MLIAAPEGALTEELVSKPYPGPAAETAEEAPAPEPAQPTLADELSSLQSAHTALREGRGRDLRPVAEHRSTRRREGHGGDDRQAGRAVRGRLLRSTR